MNATLDASRLGPLVSTASGPTWCHAPAGEPFDLDALARPGDGDRWSDGDRPTAYLAGDPLTAIAEFVRHGDPHDAIARDLVRLELDPIRVLDLRQPAVRSAIGRRAEPTAALDRAVAQRLGDELRSLGLVGALVVPSIAFLDQPERFNLVLFVEALPGGIREVLRSPTVVGSIRLDG